MKEDDPRNIKDSSRTQIAIACVAAVGVVTFLLVAFLSTSQKVSGRGLTGTVIEKVFHDEPETQFTIGEGGLREEQIAGRYILRVRVDSENGRIYRVPVAKEVFERVKQNDSYYFVKPK